MYPGKVCVAEIELGEQIGKALQDILKQLGRYELEAQLFFDNRQVLDSIARLFAQIISYLVRANFHFSRNNPIRSARAAFSSKLGQILVEIRGCELDLDREIRTASGTRLARSGEAAEAEFAKQEAFREGSISSPPSLAVSYCRRMPSNSTSHRHSQLEGRYLQ